MPKYVKQDYFSNPDKFYRVIRGDAAAQDIQQSGVVRSAKTAGVDYEPRSKGGIDLSNRPTALPSFAKGEASMSYAKANPNHHIIETKSPLSVSTSMRHGKGSTYFPPIDPKTRRPYTSLPASEVKLWKHVGDGKYQKVNIQQSLPKNTLNVKPGPALKLGLLSAALESFEQAHKEGKDVYRLGEGWTYSSGRSPEEWLKIKKSYNDFQKENPQYFNELQRLQEARRIPQVNVNSPQVGSGLNLPYQISDLLKFKQ